MLKYIISRNEKDAFSEMPHNICSKVYLLLETTLNKWTREPRRLENDGANKTIQRHLLQISSLFNEFSKSSIDECQMDTLKYNCQALATLSNLIDSSVQKGN